MTLFVVALGASFVLTGLVIQLLRRWEVLDRPNHRSSHAVPVPRGGGAAVMVAVVVAAALTDESGVWPVVLMAVVLALVGLVDDLRTLPARVRLIAQVVAGSALCAWVASDQTDLSVSVPIFAAVGLVGFVGFVNAFNFMDGINGISALNAIVAGAWFAWLGESYDLPGLTVIGCLAAGAALGFLPWNAASKVFLGDVGSYGIGALLAGAAISAWAAGVPGVLAIAPLLVYLADTTAVMVRRARAGKRLTEAHREHAYQRLVQQGWPHLVAAAWTAAVSGVLVLEMGWLYPDHRVLALLVAAALLVAYLAMPRVVEARGRQDVVLS